MEVDYETKKKMLFECLESAEKKLQGSSLEQSKIGSSFIQNNPTRKRNRDEYVDKYKHRDSLFKRPNLPINKCLKSRKRPDFEQNPNKWQHYSLDDVSDTSDRMNTTAAFNFLKELEDRDQPEEMDEEGGSGKIVFKKSIRIMPRNDEVDPLLTGKKIQSTKIVMPEYVVGEKRQKPKKERRPREQQSSSKSSSLRLSHLDEDEEDGET